MTDAKGIARGLTEAQQRALLWLPEDGTVRFLEWPNRDNGFLGADINEGLRDIRVMGFCVEFACLDTGRGWAIRPNAIAVRRELAAGRGDGE